MTKHVLSKEDVKIFKGKHYLPWFQNKAQMPTTVHKVIVFDLDETLGSFADLYILWCGLRQVWTNCDRFYDLLDMYPEFLRYGILTILEYLYDCKCRKLCHKIFVYTNNQCSKEWVHSIADYLQEKVKASYIKPPRTKLFDQKICAFQINGQPIELCRTTHQKRFDDFLQCTQLSNNADVCFVDDVEYPYMKNSKVYYICPRAYIHSLNTNQIIRRMVCAPWFPSDSQYTLLRSETYWFNWFGIHRRRMIRRGVTNVTLDLQVSQKLIYHLQEFLQFGVVCTPDRHTRKKRHRQHHTRKHSQARSASR